MLCVTVEAQFDRRRDGKPYRCAPDEVAGLPRGAVKGWRCRIDAVLPEYTATTVRLRTGKLQSQDGPMSTRKNRLAATLSSRCRTSTKRWSGQRVVPRGRVEPLSGSPFVEGLFDGRNMSGAVAPKRLRFEVADSRRSLLRVRQWRIRREEEPVCPVCIATVALMVTGAASIGGLAALAVKQLHARADARELEPTIQCKGEQDGHINAEQTRSSESSIPS